MLLKFELSQDQVRKIVCEELSKLYEDYTEKKSDQQNSEQVAECIAVTLENYIESSCTREVKDYKLKELLGSAIAL